MSPLYFRMQFTTLKEVMQEKGQAPYNAKSVKVLVVFMDNARTYKMKENKRKKFLIQQFLILRGQ